MTANINLTETSITYRRGHELLIIEACGPSGLRVRSAQAVELPQRPGALLDVLPAAMPHVERTTSGAAITNGELRAEISDAGHVIFIRAGQVLLDEEDATFRFPPSRWWRAKSGDLYSLEVRFKPRPGEKMYGLGQQQHGLLDQKGAVVDLFQMNTRVSIPFLVSIIPGQPGSLYGFLWNNPSVGRAELGHNGTRWTSEETRLMDYVVIAADTMPELLSRYADLTGHAPAMPEWALGFWQSKMRYTNQQEILDVAREYKRRGLPLAVMVADFFHWSMLGNFEFDQGDYPDAPGMVRELSEMGVRLLVSIWPQVNRESRNFEVMNDSGMLVRSRRGFPLIHEFVDRFPPGNVYAYLYDATLPEARRFVWQQVRDHYYRMGIKLWWLDADEPELLPHDLDHLLFHQGTGLEVGNIYPLMHQQAFWEGMLAEGDNEVLLLSRSAWAGSQRYGTAVWSGDINSTFDDLRRQVPAGLNVGMSGIPWWTTDIGGFLNGDPADPAFRELVVRWFQYGVFCPLFRLHGARLPAGEMYTGGPNEVWSFGEEAYPILTGLLFLREQLKPYLMELMEVASQTGLPPLRALFMEFPHDPACWQVEDQFLLGPDLLVAPVLEHDQRMRRVYLPAGADWQDAWSGETLPGSGWVEAQAPLDRIPVYWRAGSRRAFPFTAARG